MDLQKISQTSIDKLSRLLHPKGLRFFKGYDFEVATLTALGQTGEPGLLPHLAGFVLHRNAQVRHSAKVAINQLLSVVAIERLMELDGALRRSYNCWHYPEGSWSVFSPDKIATFRDPGDFGVLALSSMHPNGRGREAALKLLAHHQSGKELPFLLIRINDWAEPVRMRACEVVRQRMRVDQAGHFFNCLALILRIERCGRAQHSWLIEGVGHLLLQKENEPILQLGFASPDREIRRACFRFAVDSKTSSAPNALNVALKDHDPMARLWAARQLLSASSSDELTELCAKLARDPFMPVRRAQLEALVQQGSVSLAAILRAALLDRHASIRDLARYHLKGNFNVAQFYRNLIEESDGAQLAIAVRGLAESGVESDADGIIDLFSSTEIRLRKAAVHAVGRLAAKRYRDDLFRMLTDPSPGVCVEARTALQSIAQELELPFLASLLREHPCAFVRHNVLRLISSRSRWEQIALILAACRDPSETISRFAVDTIKKWINRANRNYVSKPTDSQLSEAILELRQSQEFLQTNDLTELETLFALWRK